MPSPAPQVIPPPCADVSAVIPDVLYSAVARVSDQAVLAQRKADRASPEEVKKYEAALAQLSSRAAALPAYPGWKDSEKVDGDAELGDHSTVFAVSADSQALSIVVVAFDATLPERVARDFLQALAAKFREAVSAERVSEAKAGKLNAELKKALKDTIKSQSDPSRVDKIMQAQAKVDQVKNIMQDNVKKILETHTSLEHLQDKSQNMSTSADLFLKNSTQARRQFEWSNLRVKAMVGASVGAVFLFCMIPVFQAASG